MLSSPMNTKKFLILILLLFYFVIINLSAQSEKFIVISPTLNLREGPGTEYKVLCQLKEGDELQIMDNNLTQWWKVQFNGTIGYVDQQFIQIDQYTSWERKNYKTGSTPDCVNIIPEFDNEIDNWLKITVGSNADVVIKLFRLSDKENKCIRVVYINSNDTCYIRHIPEGIYFLKIAFGKDCRQSISDGKCYIKFIKNAQYEIGRELLNFNIRRTSYGMSIPYYELFLDIVLSDENNFHTNTISEEEFNN